MSADRRRAIRVPLASHGVNVDLSVDGKPGHWRGEVQDASLLGLLVHLDGVTPFEPGDHVVAAFCDDDVNQGYGIVGLTTPGTVVRCRTVQDTLFAMELPALDADAHRVLRSFLERFLEAA